MTQLKIELLQEELAGLQLAAGHRQYSIEGCSNLIGQEALLPDQLERLESHTSRSNKPTIQSGNIPRDHP
jgi:hypothetical protein